MRKPPLRSGYEKLMPLRQCARDRIQLIRIVRGPLFVLVILLPLTSGCASSQVKIPGANQDSPPVITVTVFAPGANGEVEKDNVSSSTNVQVAKGTDLLISGAAKSPGGVKDLSLTITQNGRILYKIDDSNTPDANNRVSETLSIIGTNGSGGSGKNQISVKATDDIVVEARSTNFNQMANSIKVTYTPAPVSVVFSASPVMIPRGGQTTLSWATSHVKDTTRIQIKPDVPPNPHRPDLSTPLNGSAQMTLNETTTFHLIATTPFTSEEKDVTVTVMPAPVVHIKAEPNDGKIPVRGTATLTWTVANCGQDCTVTAEAADGGGFKNIIFRRSDAGAVGILKFTPRLTVNRFKVVASSPWGRSDYVKLVEQTGGGTLPTGKPFCFKMTNSQSPVNPCYTAVILATDEAHARLIAQQQHGGYTATLMDCSNSSGSCN